MSESRALVTAVVVGALVAYSCVLWVLLSRRARTVTWWLLFVKFQAAFIRTAAWLGLVLWERPEWYDTIPMFGWVVLVAQAVDALALYALARQILADDRGP